MPQDITHNGADSGIPRRSGSGPSRLSFAQERLFLLDQIMPGLSAYNVPTLYRIGTNLNEDVLRAAFDAVLERHEILRTALRLRDGEPVQEILPHEPFQLTVDDVRSLPGPEREPEAERILAELVRRPFNLSGDVLLRAALVHLAPDEDLLLVVFHHIGSDHLSGGLLYSELHELYVAGIEGRRPELPELPIQYADFAEWQRAHLEGETLEELLVYWTDHLQGAPERLELPTDRPRPNVQSYRGAWDELAIAAEEVAAVRALARSERVSLFMLLLTVFKTLLHRYSGAEDVVVGTPVSGRHYEEIASLLGCFSNTLALRTDLSGDPTFAELLARVKQTTLGGLTYQELPFEKLVEVLNPERARSHSPIFQVLFGYDIAPARERTFAGAPVRQVPVPGWESARVDLAITVHDLPDGSLRLHLGYATDLFDASRIARFGEHFRTLLGAVARQPDLRLSELPLLTDAEHRAFEKWNDRAAAVDARCLHELLSEQAARTPEAVAVLSAEGQATYAELDRRSNQLARHLAALGAGRGSLAAICLERGIDMVVALLGVLKSGAGYVPIDPTYPPQRQALMLADSDARVLITQDRFVGIFDPGAATVVEIDREWPQIAEHDPAPLATASDVDQLAYVIYTSGSTGRPKGVGISHRSLVNFLGAMRVAPGLGAEDVLLAVTTLSFDIAGLELFLPLLVGARVVITPLEATMDGVQLTDWLARSGATFMQATPTTWQLLVEAGWQGSASLRIAAGGEALPRTLADQLVGRCAEVWQMYGPTETTIWSSVTPVAREDGPPPLGGPIANTTFHVLDRHRQAAPIGVPGELYIGGDGVAVGYHNLPERTAERFITLPGESGRVYRTGDLVRWREDGRLDFLGRIDQQIKLRGFRIELGEIEAVLATHPAVAGAAAAVREIAAGDQRLVAYVVPRTGEADGEQLRQHLREKLPPFMVPALFITLEALPTTANGKLDRGALPVPTGLNPRLGGAYVPPETPIEELLASIWSEVLVIDRVGIDDDFFELGGHSMLAVRMLARIHDAFGFAPYLGSLFDHSTIRKLAELLMLDMLADASEAELADLLES